MAVPTLMSQQLVLASDDKIFELRETAEKKPTDLIEGKTYVAKLPGRSQPVLIRKRPEQNKASGTGTTSAIPRQSSQTPSAQFDGNDARRLSTYQVLRNGSVSQGFGPPHGIQTNGQPVSVDSNGNLIVGGVAFAPIPGQGYMPQNPHMVQPQIQPQVAASHPHEVRLVHRCGVCGRWRSPGYHARHPLAVGERPSSSPCRRCRQAHTTDENSDEEYDQQRNRAKLQSRKKSARPRSRSAAYADDLSSASESNDYRRRGTDHRRRDDNRKRDARRSRPRDAALRNQSRSRPCYNQPDDNGSEISNHEYRGDHERRRYRQGDDQEEKRQSYHSDAGPRRPSQYRLASQRRSIQYSPRQCSPGRPPQRYIEYVHVDWQPDPRSYEPGPSRKRRNTETEPPAFRRESRSDEYGIPRSRVRHVSVSARREPSPEVRNRVRYVSVSGPTRQPSPEAQPRHRPQPELGKREYYYPTDASTTTRQGAILSDSDDDLREYRNQRSAPTERCYSPLEKPEMHESYRRVRVVASREPTPPGAPIPPPPNAGTWNPAAPWNPHYRRFSESRPMPHAHTFDDDEPETYFDSRSSFTRGRYSTGQ